MLKFQPQGHLGANARPNLSSTTSWTSHMSHVTSPSQDGHSQRPRVVSLSGLTEGQNDARNWANKKIRSSPKRRNESNFTKTHRPADQSPAHYHQPNNIGRTQNSSTSSKSGSRKSSRSSVSNQQTRNGYSSKGKPFVRTNILRYTSDDNFRDLLVLDDSSVAPGDSVSQSSGSGGFSRHRSSGFCERGFQQKHRGVSSECSLSRSEDEDVGYESDDDASAVEGEIEWRSEFKGYTEVRKPDFNFNSGITW